MLKRVSTVLLVLAFSLPAVYSQSLVDLAKKEKARRAELKEKRGPVVTNADLGKGKAAEEKTAGEQSTRPRQPGTSPAASQRVIPVLTNSPQTPLDRQEPSGGSRLFATRVRSEFEVESPQNALKKPDGAFAEIRYYGYLDLEIELVNQDGDDVAVYSRGPGAGVLPEMMAYAVFAESEKGGEENWIFLGQGNGRGGPETFDLGDLTSARSLRILYRMFPAERELAKPLRDYPREYGMRIDAVKSLH
jgi:hypothetical protein